MDEAFAKLYGISTYLVCKLFHFGRIINTYYIGDHDPSGLDIARTTESGLRLFAPSAEIHFQRLAVTPEQIAAWNLMTRPIKKTDSRAKTFLSDSVEVDQPMR